MTATVECRVLHGECVDRMKELADASVHAVVCDPPYGIEFLGRGWDTFRAEDKDLPPNAAFQKWCEQWARETLRVLTPGGHLLSFGGTRTYHRLAAGVEDAGFEVRDSLHWIYGGAMPHARRADDLIDRHLGVAREVVGKAVGTDTSTTRPGFTGEAHSRVANADHEYDVTAATSPEAKEWVGWTTALKPAHEPIVLARKPLGGSVAQAVLANGTGALNTGACEIGEGGGVRHRQESAGRWPSNVLFAHLTECEGFGSTHTEALCAPGCPVAALNATVEGAAAFFYVAKPRRREKIGGTIRNLHVTVKPIDLMRYLARLVTPPAGTILDPFLGSGTTGCAAMAEGFSFIGIERDQDSYDTALARISDWAFANGHPRPVGELQPTQPEG